MNCCGNQKISKPTMLLNENDMSQPSLTNEFVVEDRPAVVQLWNPIEGSFLCLMELIIPECGSGLITPATSCGEFVCLSCCQPKIEIRTPGRYKLMKRGIMNNDAVSVKYVGSSMSSCNAI